MKPTKFKVCLRNERWVIQREGHGELWAWVNTFEGAIFEAIQLATKGYREVDINGVHY